MNTSISITQHIYSIITILNVFLAFFVIFLERKNVGHTWAWLMVLLFLPVVGFILYAILGQNLSRRKLYKLKEDEQLIVDSIMKQQWQRFKQNHYPHQSTESAEFQDMIIMNLTSAMAIYTQDNEIDIFIDGNEKFEALIEDIKQAKKHIHLMYYIINNDVIGRQLRNQLVQKAREGVEVRILFDDIGSSRLKSSYFKPLIEAGGVVKAFFPSRIPYLNIRVNYRNHRKIVVIDDEVGYIGGINVGDEYLGLNKRIGYWRDTHLRIVGGAVMQLQAQFYLDWNLASPNDLRPSWSQYTYKLEKSASVKNKAGIQIVSSGPDNELEQIKNAYIKLIHKAKQSVWIQTPYFIPDDSLLEALKMAAFAGIDVRIMIPKVPDKQMVYWATYSYLGDLLPLGVKCFLYEKGFLHAKTMIVDGIACSVGTANFDRRSFMLNFETNAFIYNQSISSRMVEIYQEDLKVCSELTLKSFRERPIMQKAIESFIRLLSPIL